MAEICEIRSGSPGGPRFDASLNVADRHGYENLVLLCPTHHRLVDEYSASYGVDKLQQFKAYGLRPTMTMPLGDDTLDWLLRQGAQESAVVVPSPQQDRVLVFWHDDGLTKDEALGMVSSFADLGVQVVIVPHVDPSPPDAVFIGSEAEPALVRHVIGTLQEVPKFVFPVNYPDSECGALSDFSVSVGLLSSTRESVRGRAEEPYPMSDSDWSWLLEPGLDRSDFRRRLAAVAAMPRQPGQLRLGDGAKSLSHRQTRRGETVSKLLLPFERLPLELGTVEGAIASDLGAAAIARNRQRSSEQVSASPTGLQAKMLALRAISPGRADANAYHSAAFAVVSELFARALSGGTVEVEINEGRKRVDIVFENSASTGFFRWLTDNYPPAGFVFVECKNFSADIANPELDQLFGRLNRKRGAFGLLLCREVVDWQSLVRRCRDGVAEDKYVIVLSDDRLETLVNAADRSDSDSTDAVDAQLRAWFAELVL